MRRMRAVGIVGLTLLAAGAAIGACTTAEAPVATVSEEVVAVALERRGETLFTEETFDGNGRVCSTCHEPDLFGTITPEFVQQQYALDPTGPLFRAIDSDDGEGTSYRRLLEHATIRVPIETPFIDSIGRAIRKCAAPEETTVVLHRGNPSVFNAALEEALMHDGRDGGDLETQARNAITTHNEPGRHPAPEELTAIAAFQESLYSHAAVKAFLDSGAELRLPDGNTPSEMRGRQFFEPDRQCGICHSGPMLNRTSEFHTDVIGSRFESSSVGAEPDNPNEKFEWCFVDPATNEISPPEGVPEPVPEWVANGRVFSRPVADPGIALLGSSVLEPVTILSDGSEAVVDPVVVSAGVGLPLFKIPTLWGTPDTAPYFHDNSAKDLEEVLLQYNFMFRDFRDFAERVGCDPEATDCLSEQDQRDIIDYLQLLSFEGKGIRPSTPR